MRGGRAREESGYNWERKRETAGVGKGERDGEKRKRTRDGSKDERKMTHFLYCEKSVRPAHAPTPANQHPHRNLRRMSQKRMHNYTNTIQDICVSATLSATDARSAPTHMKSTSVHLDLNLGNMLPFPFYPVTAQHLFKKN